MQKVNLLNLSKGVSSWAELEAWIIALSSEQERGEAFEQFCKAYFCLDPVFQAEKVYRQNEITHTLRKKLGYPGIQDIGIDGLFVNNDGKLFAYQAKFRSDRNNTPTLRELSTFFTMSDKADWRITITNANRLPTSIDERTRHSRVLSDRLYSLDPDFFNRLRIYLEDQSINPPKRKIPNKTQQEVIDKALSYFRENTRGQLILPCGTGKTLASMWIAEKLKAQRILILIPSLALLSQTLREWAFNTSLTPFRYLCLCSDTTVDLGNDSPIEHLYEMNIPVTTDTETVSEFLKKNPSSPSILFTTYQSSKVLSTAAIKTGTTFDIAIFDEAHRTTGAKAGVWNIAIDDKNVPIKKRLFMTATPRIYAPHIVKKAEDEDVLICSMGDTSIYGKPFYEMTFGDAIERGHITDYKIVVICVTDSEVKEIIQRGGRVVTDDEHEWDAKAFAKRVALIKGINKYSLKRVFTFHSRVNGAKAFTDTKTPYGIEKVFSMILPDNAKQVKAFHVNGTMSSGIRSSLLKEFEQAEIGIMSNARCLTEGVDIPDVDTVAFIDPKRSLIDIVQATGRAMRKAEWKERGYIFIPVIVDENADPEQFIESSDFDTVWQVLQAMVDQDQRLTDVVSQLRIMQGKGEEGTQAWKDAMNEYAEKVEFFNLPTRIDKTRFINTLQTKTVEVIGKSWDFWYGLTLRYKEELGDANVPGDYQGFPLGRWQVGQRQSYKKDRLSPYRIQRLEEIGFMWSPHNEAFEKGFNETLKYKERFGEANAPQSYKTENGFRLGTWQDAHRGKYRKGEMTKHRIKRFEAIGFKWTLMDEAFEQGFQETLKYKEQFGDPYVPKNYKTLEGFPLGSWQHAQRQMYRKGKMLPERIKRFKDIGYDWYRHKKSLDAAFERGFQETLKYKEQFGEANAPYEYTTSEGFKLGQWQTDQRQFHKKGKISKDRIQKLQEVGFKWYRYEELLDEKFNKGFHESMKFRQQFGNPNAPQGYKTPESYTLGSWQMSLRKFYKKGKLSPDRIKRLEEIDFKWAPKDEFMQESFDRGIRETLNYKKQFNDSNAPNIYKTQKGYPLGQWQVNIRQKYKRSQLSPDRIKILEEIGFKWEFREEAFEKGFQETLRYKDQFKSPHAPNKYLTTDGYKLGTWQSEQRVKYRNSKLSSDKIQRLEDIGFKWYIYEEFRVAAFEKGFQETLKYNEQYGNPNAPKNYKTEEGYLLGSWQVNQRQFYKRGKLSESNIHLLEKIGFKWNTKKAAFERGVQETLKYKEQFGDPNAPKNYKMPEKYPLGAWQNTQRVFYKKGTLSPERIKRLEGIGFKWDHYDDNLKTAFETGFKETLKYLKQWGHPNAPRKYVTPNGFNLGNWHGMLRQKFKKAALSDSQIERLTKIGFEWDPHGAAFKKGIQGTISYKEQFSKPNAPNGYVTPEGFNLGSWQAVQIY
ncbi:MAG: hypothetical protein A2W05_02625 [Candidatus Schekmanbacteria bacterium RBG_16_38_10]|uniref:Helicase n=1 Tax=Candidatus Schekmanbacteria bacterium RBG_16_38_10 TaxID=1817879 RepID=A0A1F7RMG7_9BACT|nr:MAG: hypothetical protein A2W05_02625 [Candidatus Schekmanbacteria bacterium RBG_16_38_10]